MSMDALQRLVAKTRPFKTFTLKLEGGDEAFQVRRTSVLENEQINQVYTKTYDEAVKRVQDDTSVDYSLMHRDLAKRKPEELAKYIAEATRPDIESDVRDLYDAPSEEADDKEVAEYEAMIEKRTSEEVEKFAAELKTHSMDELLESALDKREHFQALYEANRARMRLIASLTIYTTDGERLFPTTDDVGALDEKTLNDLIKAASDALAKDDRVADPLK
jgi:hypothetical protein